MRRSIACIAALVACQERVSEPGRGSAPPPPPAARAPASSAGPGQASPGPPSLPSAPPPLSSGPIRSRPVASVPVAPDDPLRGKFTLAQATAGLPSDGDLYAVMSTSLGKLVCELWPDKAPLTVANFVGLARGLRPYKKDGKWLKKPLYDGTEFYSVIKNFALEAGSPGAAFNAEIGYFIPDEIWDDARHDQRGLLCMRAFKPDRSGSQFMILDGAAPQLDNSFTIFGKCGPSTVLDAISGAPVENARPKPAIELRKLTIVRSKQPPS